jgi:hypothetical protein
MGGEPVVSTLLEILPASGGVGQLVCPEQRVSTLLEILQGASALVASRGLRIPIRFNPS